MKKVTHSANYFSEQKRVLTSFGGKCPFKCLHCYTFSKDFPAQDLDRLSSIDGIINKLKKKHKFNVIYVSGYKENFENPDDGLDLLEALFSEFKCHILFTTRNVFEEKHILRISNLNKLMEKSKKHLFACVSIPAYDSYKKLEPNSKIPNPEKRIEFLKQLYNNGITTFLTLRPICPNSFIPTGEYIKILEKSYTFCNAVIASGIHVDEHIVKRLKTFPEFKHKQKKWACFNNMAIQVVDVKEELLAIKMFCKGKVRIFKTSIPAINHFYNKTKGSHSKAVAIQKR